MGIRCADHVTPLYQQKLALTSPTGGGRSVCIVRSRTKAKELELYINYNFVLLSLDHPMNMITEVLFPNNKQFDVLHDALI